MLDENHAKCILPDISKPGTMTVEISNNGNDFTHDGLYFTYYDAFNLNADAKIISREGTSTLHVTGFGYANTGSELKC